MGMTTAFGIDRDIVEIVDPRDIEGDMIATFNKSQITIVRGWGLGGCYLLGFGGLGVAGFKVNEVPHAHVRGGGAHLGRVRVAPGSALGALGGGEGDGLAEGHLELVSEPGQEASLGRRFRGLTHGRDQYIYDPPQGVFIEREDVRKRVARGVKVHGM